MIVKYTDLGQIRQRWKDQKIVCASGTFDILDVRHINFLKKLSKMGDKVVILINHDWRVRQRKGPNRPFNPQMKRATVIETIRWVDAVGLCPKGPQATERCLEKLKPNFYVSIHRGRWKDSKEFFRRNGIRFIHLPRERGGSTTLLVKKILRAHRAGIKID